MSPVRAQLREGDLAGAPALASVGQHAAQLPRVRSLLVQQRGALVLERYYHGFRAGRTANVKSVSKSIISALVGLAVARGAFRVDQTLGELLPAYLKAPEDAAKRAITVEDLLTMRSGLESTSGRNYGAWVSSRDWVRYVLNQPLVATPGTAIDYSTGNTHLLSAILTRTTKQSTWQFAQDALAKPLGTSLAPWPRDPQGIFFGGNDMLLTPRQMIAFGELYLRGGRSGERQVIPEHWVATSLVSRGRSYWSDQQYGYGWWIRPIAGEAAFYAWGFGGQFIVVVPGLELVIATTSLPTVSDDRREHRNAVWQLIEQVVQASVHTTR